MDTSGYPNAYASSASFDAALAVAEKEAAAARASAERSATLLSKMSRSGSLGSGRRSQGYALLDAAGETLLARAVSPDRGGSPVRWPPGQGNGGAARVAAQRSLNLELPVKEDGLGAEAKAPVLGRSKSGTELDDMEELAIRVSLRLEAEESGGGRPSLKRQSSANEREAPLKELWDAVFNSDEPSVSPAKLFSFASAYDWTLLLLASLFAFVSGGCLPATLYFFSGTMDSVGAAMAGGFNSDEMLHQSKMIMGVGCVYAASTAAYTALADIAKAHQTAEYKKRYLGSILRQDVGWFDTSNPQELSTRFGEAMLAIEEGVSFKAVMMLEAVYTLVFSYALGFYYGWDICLVVFAVSPIAGLSGAIAIFIALTAGQKMSDAYAAAGAIASEALSSIRTVAAFGLERVAAERYERKLKKAEKIGIALVWQAGFAMSWMIAAICIMMVSGLLYGGLDVSSEQQASAFEYAVDMTWGQIFDSMGMFETMKAQALGSPPPPPPTSPGGGGGGGGWFGGGPDWGSIAGSAIGGLEGAGAWAAGTLGYDSVHYKYCTYDCGDTFNMLNLDFQSALSLYAGQEMPFAARSALGMGSCDSEKFNLQPFQLTCATAGALVQNATALRMFLQQDNATIFESYAVEAGSWMPCRRTGASVLLAMFAVQIGAMHFVLIAQNAAVLMKACRVAAPVHETIERVPQINSFATGGVKLQAVRGDISVRDVVFAYPAAPEHVVCNGYSLEIGAGQTCALCGPSGSGKSTIIALVERFYDPISGAVFLDGVDLRDVNVRWLRQQIGLVGQEPVLFVGTVAENIAYGKEGASREEVEEAARNANAHGFIMSNLPNGYESSVGQGGGMLSGGQKQRIAIARAVVRKPAILLLDEATSALDTTSERVVQAAIDEIMQKQRRTTVTIAHRLSTIRHADKIAVVDQGVVVEQGTWDELVAIDGGKFQELANRQPAPAPDEAAVPADADDDVLITAYPSLVSSTSRTTAGAGDTALLPHSPLPPGQHFQWSGKAGAPELSVGKHDEKEWVFWRVSRLQKRGDGLLLAIGARPLGGSFFSMLDGWAVPALGFAFTKLSVSLFRTDPGRIHDDVIFWAIAYVAIGFAFVPVVTCELGLFGMTGEHLTRNLRAVSIRSLVKQEIGFFDDPENSAGALTLFLGEKLTLVQAVNGEKLAVAIRQISTICFGTFLVFKYGYWQLGVVMLASAPVMAVAMGLLLVVVFGIKNPRPTGEGPQAQKNVGSLVGEVVLGIRTVASYGAERRFYEEYERTCDTQLRQATRASALTGCAVGIGKGAPVIFIGAVCYYGCILITADVEKLTANIMKMFLDPDAVADGDIQADAVTGCADAQIYELLEKFLIPVMVIFFMSIGMGAVGVIVTDSQNALSAARLLFALLSRRSRIDPTDNKGTRLRGLRGDISVQNVIFAYPAAPDHIICNGYSLEIGAGQTCALCGPSGSGKSTIINLIERFYDPISGAVFLDGVDLRNINVRWLRSQIALVGQEPVLFLGTVAENIAYGKEGASREEVEEAARNANAHGFIMSNLPHGYNTNVGIRGGMLSGGQKQRIAIARAVVRKPAILLLDEATSALDTTSERVVQAAIDEIMQKQRRTTVTIAHRLSTIRHADKIAVVDRGVVVEQGRHEELMSLNGVYAGLIAAQNT